VGGDWRCGPGHTVGVCGGQQGVRARIRAAGKALDGDDRRTDTQTMRPLYKDIRWL